SACPTHSNGVSQTARAEKSWQAPRCTTATTQRSAQGCQSASGLCISMLARQQCASWPMTATPDHESRSPQAPTSEGGLCCALHVPQTRLAQQRQHRLDEIRQLVPEIYERDRGASEADLAHLHHLLGYPLRRADQRISPRTSHEPLAMQAIGLRIM